MKKFRIPIIAALIAVIVLFVVDLRFNLIDSLVVQFSSEKYAEYVSETDYEKELSKEPLCSADRNNQGIGDVCYYALLKSER